MTRAFAMVLAMMAGQAAASTCYGTVSAGRLEGGVALPARGDNFIAYSTSPIVQGRRFVHARVAEIVLDAYTELRERQPELKFMYGETGLQEGGRFKPHRTHQNGLSADFFVPLRDASGKPALLRTALDNRFGYDIEFDQRGRYRDYQVDFAALAEHLYQLHRSALKHQAGVNLVILEPAYVAKVLATRRGGYLKQHVPFMRTRPWVRHDEHFHVDFKLACKPLN